MFASTEELKKAYEDGKFVYSPSLRDYMVRTHSKPAISDDEARDILAQCRNTCLRGGYYGKNNRPWVLVDLCKELSNSSAWLGFEFEMGFSSDEDRIKTSEWLWDSINHSSQDREGHGAFVLEATFKPQNAEDIGDGTADILKLYDFFAREKIDIFLPAKGTGMCGTHVNISTPLLRKLDTAQASAITTTLYHAMAGSPRRYNLAGEINPATGIAELRERDFILDGTGGILSADHVKFFGRRPYGWCNFRTGGHYIEFKVFASTEDRAQFTGQYQRTVNGLIEAVDVLAEAALKGEPLDSVDITSILHAAHAVDVKQPAVAA